MSFSFLRTKTSFFFVFFYPPFVIFFFGETALSIHPLFNDCEPYSCGEGPNISYPFYVYGIQPSYCGFPGFNLVCDDRKPLLQISQNELYLTKIFPNNQSVALVSKNFPRDNCPRDIKNLTLSRTPFSYEPTKLNLTFFFNCNGSFPDGIRNYQINCMTNGTHRSYATLYGKKVVGLKCETAAEAPAGVLAEGDVEGYLLRNDYLGMFKKGFLFKWTASNCSDCESSGGRCGFNSSQFWCFCHDRPHKVKCQSSKKIKRKVVIGVSAGAVGSVVGGFLFCFLYFYCRSKCSSTASSTSGPRNFSSKSDLEKCYSYQYATHIFPYKELEEATNNFDSSGELGDGGFGTVYYGKLRDGRSVAVKRLYENNYKRVKQFINEVKILSGLRHQNLVSLYGCTSRHSHELLLVYEFIPNGTVADHLHGDRAKPGALTWPIRMKIAIETAEALAYLHAIEPPIIHRDVKTNNILLDNDFHVKVADFGLSRLFPTDATHVSTTPQGTPGYVDPDYHKCYQLTDRSDVYSFGVVLIELISSKPAVDISRHRYEINLATMAINKIHNQAFHELVDSSLGYESDCRVRKMIILVSELAFRCLQEEKEGRPSMDEVVEELSRISSEEYQAEKKMTEVPDNSTDEIGLLKSIPPPSPDTVMGTWVSKSSTASINS